MQKLSLKCEMSDKVGAKMTFWKLVVASASREKENQSEQCFHLLTYGAKLAHLLAYGPKSAGVCL